MARLTGSAPILLVRDVMASADYFRDAIGFTYDRFWGDPPDFCILRRDGLSLMIAQLPKGQSGTPHWRIRDKMWNVYFWVDDVDALYAELNTSGARIDYTLHDQPYGVREFGIQDLDDHDIAFGQVL